MGAKESEIKEEKMDNSDVSEILSRSNFPTPINQIGLAYSPLISVPYNTPEGYSRNQMMTPSIFQSPRLLSTFQSFQNLNLRQSSIYSNINECFPVSSIILETSS